MQPPDFDPNIDYYKALGIPKSASEKDIKVQYYKLAQQYHPDKNGGKTTEKFKEISAAYNVIGNPGKRKEYDSMRQYSQSAQQSHSYGSGQSRTSGPQGGFGQQGGFGGFGGFSGFGQNQQSAGSFYEQQQRQRQRAEEMRKQRDSQQQQQQYDEQQYYSQQQNGQKKSGYTYYRDKYGREYYEFKGDPKDFYEELFRKQQEAFRQQERENQTRSNFNQSSSGNHQYDDFFKQGFADQKQKEQTHQAAQKKKEQEWESYYKSPFEQWQEQQNGYYNDPNIQRALFLRAFLRGIFFFFGFLFTWKLLFGYRKKQNYMDEYQLYQMHHDPAMYARMAQNPQAAFDQRAYQQFSNNPHYVAPPPPQHVSFDGRKPNYPQ